MVRVGNMAHFAIIPLTPSATKTIILGSPKDSPRFGQKRIPQQALLSDKGIIDDFINSQFALVNKILLPKWFTKVKIVVSPDYHFTVIAMIDSGVDMNCIFKGEGTRRWKLKHSYTVII